MPEIRTANGSITAERAGANSVAWVHGIFAGAAAGSGLVCYMLSQSLQPALESAGLGGIWLDVCLLAGGLVGLALALSPRPLSRGNGALRTTESAQEPAGGA